MLMYYEIINQEKQINGYLQQDLIIIKKNKEGKDVYYKECIKNSRLPIISREKEIEKSNGFHQFLFLKNVYFRVIIQNLHIRK